MHRQRSAQTRALTLRLLCFAALVALVLGLPNEAAAYSWMVRHGEAQCANCHADPSGGELLTRYGRQAGTTVLAMPWRTMQQTTEKQAGPTKSGFLWGLWDTPRYLLLGGSFRLAGFAQDSVRVFPMQMDLYGQLRFGRVRFGGSLGVAKVKQNSPNARAAFVTANQGDAFNLLSRTHWIGLDLGSNNAWTLRAGRLNLPFGVRIVEHYAWVRDITRTDRDSDQQHGAALAYNGRALRGEIMAIAGNYQIRPDRYRERGYSGYAEYLVNDGLALGISSLVTVAKADSVSFEQERTLRGAHGAFARARLIKPLVLLAEADVVHTSRRVLGYVAFAQLDYEIIQGLHLFTTLELEDRGKHDTAAQGISYQSVPGAGSPRAAGWLSADWFFWNQLELRVDALFRQDAGATFLAQIHAYL
jgi:hypothetical protein